MLHMIVLLYSPTSIFLPTIYLRILGIVGFCYMEQSSLLPLGTSRDLLLSVQLMVSLSIQADIIIMPVVYGLDHTFYFYLTIERYSFSIQLILSHTILMLLEPVVLYTECSSSCPLTQRLYQSTIFICNGSH